MTENNETKPSKQLKFQQPVKCTLSYGFGHLSFLPDVIAHTRAGTSESHFNIVVGQNTSCLTCTVSYSIVHFLNKSRWRLLLSPKLRGISNVRNDFTEQHGIINFLHQTLCLAPSI